jgi:RNA-binding proteins (RRM domain)
MSDRERSRSRSRSRSQERRSHEGPDHPDSNGHLDHSEEVKLYIGNIDYGTTGDALRDYFEKYGTVTDAFVPTERGTNRPRGFGFVTFSNREDAVAAMEKLDGTELDGRMIRISESKPREKSNGTFNASGSSEVKLFVGNLSFETKTEAIKALFETIGQVNDCYMPSDRGSGRPRGFAFVTMPATYAEEAMRKLTGEELDGRAIRIEEAGGKKASKDDYRGTGGYGGSFGGGDRYGGDRYGDRGYDRGYDRGGRGYRDYDRGGRDDRDRRRDYDRDYDRRGKDYDKDYDRRRDYDRGYGERRRDYDRDDRYGRDRSDRYKD